MGYPKRKKRAVEVYGSTNDSLTASEIKAMKAPALRELMALHGYDWDGKKDAINTLLDHYSPEPSAA